MTSSRCRLTSILNSQIRPWGLLHCNVIYYYVKNFHQKYFLLIKDLTFRSMYTYVCIVYVYVCIVSMQQQQQLKTVKLGFKGPLNAV